VLLGKFIVGILIEKLSESWNDYKNSLKYKHKSLSLDELVTYILIEDINKKKVNAAKANEMALKVNLVQSNSFKRYNNKSHDYKLKISNPNFKKKKDSCFVYGKLGHYAP
jgi:hypothetical protein